MEADPLIKKDQENKAKTLAQERKQVTPGDADSWDDSELSSESSISEEMSGEVVEQNILQDISKDSGWSKMQQKREEKGKEEKKEEIKEEKPQANQRLADIQKMKQREKQYLTFYHTVGEDFMTLLRIMVKTKAVNLVQITGLKEEGDVYIPVKGNRIIIRAFSKQKANFAINILSDYVDDLNIIKLDIKTTFASKLQKFSCLRQSLKKRNIFIFGRQNSKSEREIFIGGLIKMPQLRKFNQQLKNYKILNFSLRNFRNKRSYKIIVNEIFKSEFMLRELARFNKISMIEVDFGTNDACLRYLMNTTSKTEVAQIEYEDFITKMIGQFSVVTFILRKERYYEKLAVPEHPEIVFKITKEHNVGIAYLMIICQKSVFFKESKLIQKELQKIGELIIGIRFFNYIDPSFRFLVFESNAYIVRKFPNVNTYSMCVTAKTKQGFKFNWKQIFSLLLDLKDKLSADQSMLLD